MSQIHYFLDIDGLLADFVQGCCSLHFKEIPDPWPSLCYRLDEALDIEPIDFWKNIDEDFWATLPVHDEAYKIIDCVLRQTKGNYGRITLLTSLPSVVDNNKEHDPPAAAGKVRWLNLNFPVFKYSLTTCKSDHAHANAILIDDSDTEIRKFRSNGGEGVLVPRPWNSLRSKRKDSVAWVGKQLESIVL